MSSTITITDADITTALSTYGDYTPSLESLTEGGYLEAIRDILAMEAADEDAFTWLDEDPEVAWGADTETEPTYHGRLREIYYSIGWEACYHERGHRATFHYNVKMNGNGAYRAYHDRVNEVNASRAGLMDTDEVTRITGTVEEWERESWWDLALADSAIEFGVGTVRDPETRRAVRGTEWYSCGRSGGYATMPEHYMTHGVAMVLMAWTLESARDYYNGSDWGTYLADQAIERYDETALEELASPRVDAWY